MEKVASVVLANLEPLVFLQWNLNSDRLCATLAGRLLAKVTLKMRTHIVLPSEKSTSKSSGTDLVFSSVIRVQGSPVKCLLIRDLNLLHPVPWIAKANGEVWKGNCWVIPKVFHVVAMDSLQVAFEMLQLLDSSPDVPLDERFTGVKDS